MMFNQDYHRVSPNPKVSSTPLDTLFLRSAIISAYAWEKLEKGKYFYFFGWMQMTKLKIGKFWTEKLMT